MMERVAEWAREQGLDVARLVSADGVGSDWEGSTEGGFYDVFRVDIRYEDSAGQIQWEDVSGERMASLWQFVVVG